MTAAANNRCCRQNGNIIESSGENLGSAGNFKRLAYDKDGKVIGYVTPDGTVKDFKGNLIGRMSADGTILDKKGRAIGKAGDFRKVATDKTATLSVMSMNMAVLLTRKAKLSVL